MRAHVCLLFSPRPGALSTGHWRPTSSEVSEELDYRKLLRNSRGCLRSFRASGMLAWRGVELLDRDPSLRMAVDDWMTLATAAARFGVKRDRLERAALEGRLRGRKLGAGKTMPWL